MERNNRTVREALAGEEFWVPTDNLSKRRNLLAAKDFRLSQRLSGEPRQETPAAAYRSIGRIAQRISLQAEFLRQFPSCAFPEFMTMQRHRQPAHREDLLLLRNYVTGDLRRELDGEIERLGKLAGEEMAVSVAANSWPRGKTEWAGLASPAK